MLLGISILDLVVLLPCGLAIYWAGKVDAIVTEPYLDEFFHVRQAVAYVGGNWTTWDPKITTPPGLYLISWLQLKIAARCGYLCQNLAHYRSINQLALLPFNRVVQMLLAIIHQLEASKTSSSARSSDSAPSIGEQRLNLNLVHSAANVLLFPPLFFFSALYYTDMLSTLSVMVTYLFYLERKPAWMIILAGWASLWFRQTNVFWVVIYLGALEMRTAMQLLPQSDDAPDKITTLDVVRLSWNTGRIYDPAIKNTSQPEFLKMVISFAIACAANVRSLWRLTPYVVILLSFIAFIVWNGGVVLGDKSNHVATIHLAQMLYIWPYMTFFSLPLLWPYLARRILPRRMSSALLGSDFPLLKSQRWIAVFLVLAMLGIVHFNTIVHPFILADNRHYTFYIFRLLLRTHPLTRYLAVPIYYLCAWAVFSALVERRQGHAGSVDKGDIAAGRKSQRTVGQHPSPKNPPRSSPISQQGIQHGTSLRSSWLLIWLVTTALTLSTAPLVEPRYCILPWLTWRLQVPLTSVHDRKSPTSREGEPVVADVLPLRLSVSTMLWLETAWLLLINLVTGYVFLYRGFSWPSEPGKVQRFMW